MPRLLLVDDNPSIHKIAETLLATSPIELVCADSAAAALEKVNRGERFDVALVDTSMAGIDGWSLVEMLRGIPATARIPIAMMAGVLDTVDPERIREAPIQGFLKKPVELRELGDRILRLLETPVPLPEPTIPKLSSPFATMPATRLDDLPEFRQKQEAAALAIAPEVEDDLLELTEEDLYVEAPETLAEPVEESLDLEELDLDSLRGLSIQPEEVPAAVAPDFLAAASADAAVPDAASADAAVPEANASEPTPQEGSWPVEQLDAIATLDRLPAVLPGIPSSEVELPDLGAPTEEIMDIASLGSLPVIEEVVTADEVSFAALIEEPREEVSFTPPLPPLEESLDWSDDSDSMLSAVQSFEAPEVVLVPEDAELQTSTAAAALPGDELDLLDVSVPELVPEPHTLQLELEDASPVLAETATVEAPAAMEPEPAASALAASALAASALAAFAVDASTPAEAIVESALLETAAAPAEEPLPVLEPVAAVSPLGSRELLDAVMADPVLMDALAKAVVARLGDQVLREIAWEVMPELADRLPRS